MEETGQFDRARRRVLLGIRLLIFIVLSTAAEFASAALPGEYVSLPAAGQKPKHGIRATVDARWVDANGYRPVRIQISTTPNVPATADRSFDIELESTGWYGQIYQPTVSKTLELPEGASSVDAVLHVPQFQTWNSLTIKMYENGRELKEMAFASGINAMNSNQWTEASPTMLFIDSDAPTLTMREGQVGTAMGAIPTFNVNSQPGANTPKPNLPDIRSLVALFHYNYGNVALPNFELAPTDDRTTLSFVASIQQVEMLPPAELPDDWLSYSCFDVLFISYEDLRAIQTGQPKKLAALRRWVSTGPTLVVYGAGDELERLAEIEELLSLPSVTGSSTGEFRSWTPPNPSLRGKGFQTPQGVIANSGGQWIYQNGQQVWVNNINQSRPSGNAKGTIYERGAPVSGQPLFVMRDAGFGKILAFGVDSPFPGTVQDWEWMFHSIGDSNWKWYQRHGASLNRANQHYWNWLVPGVGMPPVTSFLVLISVFVVVIGPINYFVLGRMRRLYLLLVTVPLGAGLVTACLFLFALFTDGLGVKGRVRSVTLLDQTHNEAVSWSRQTYYASIAPSRGLTFPGAAAVYPVELYPYNLSRSESRRRYINWDDEQNLRSGFIRSRTQNQFMIGYPSETEAKLRVKQSETQGEPLQVENLLGTRIEHLVICDSRGQLHYAEGLSPNEAQRAKSMSPEQVKDRLTPIFGAARPSNPEYMDTSRYDNSYTFDRSWYYSQRSNIDSDQPATTHLTSVLESEFRKLSSAGYSVPPRHYLAIVERGPDVPLGVPELREFSSFHVIIGRF